MQGLLETHRAPAGELLPVIGFKASAYEDYLSARLLYQNGILTNATIMACQALEKLIKCILYVWKVGFPDTHDLYVLYKTMKNRVTQRGKQQLPDKHFIKELNEEFLQLLSKVYKARYYDKLSVGYNYVILQNKCLVELDFTFPLLDSLVLTQPISGPSITPSFEEMVQSGPYARDVREGRPALYDGNFALLGVERTELSNCQELVFEMRVQKKKVVTRVTYNLEKGSYSPTFLYEGFRPIDDSGRKFATAFPAEGIQPMPHARLDY